MASDNNRIGQASNELRKATAEVAALVPFEDTYPELTLDDAYAVQMASVQAWTKEGRVRSGYKIGLTNQAGQQAFGLTEPALGHLFKDMCLDSGETQNLGELYQPKVEGELAFVLGHDLAGPGVSALDVRRATYGVVAALEIMDTRFQGWQVKAPGLIADNCSGARYVLDSKVTPLDGLEPRYFGFVLQKNGQVIGSGAGVNVLGDPLESVAWLANKLASLGLSLKAGEVVMSGAVIPPVVAEGGDLIHLTVDRVGQVFCRFDARLDR